MSHYRFYIPDLLAQLAGGSGEVALSEDEAHHARNVLRLAAGTAVDPFDGNGAWVSATIVEVSRRAVRVRVDQPPHHELPPAIQLTLCTAVPKGERADWLVEQASQLNVAAIQWLDCGHSVVRPREGGAKIDKWRRLAIESAKQCGRHFVMDIHEPVSAEKYLQKIVGSHSPTPSRTLWLDPGPAGQTAAHSLADFQAGGVLAFVGPEGGWSDAERALLENQVAAAVIRRVRLTPTVLRIETACAAIAAIVGSTPATQVS